MSKFCSELHRTPATPPSRRRCTTRRTGAAATKRAKRDAGDSGDGTGKGDNEVQKIAAILRCSKHLNRNSAPRTAHVPLRLRTPVPILAHSDGSERVRLQPI